MTHFRVHQVQKYTGKFCSSTAAVAVVVVVSVRLHGLKLDVKVIMNGGLVTIWKVTIEDCVT
jgi:hypothetical protein